MSFIQKSSILFRLDNLKTLKNNYENNQIEFSCPANWIDYFNKNKAIGDVREGALACFQSMEDVKRYLGNEYVKGKNKYIVEDQKCFFCYQQDFILIPTICFYSIETKSNDFKDDILYRFDLANYEKNLFNDNNEKGLFLITNYKLFINDVKDAVDEILKKNCYDNIAKQDFYTVSNKNQKAYFSESKNAILYKDVEYKKLGQFFINKNCVNNIFIKDSNYSWQSEFRITIPNLRFLQNLTDGYMYEKNKLSVKLKNLHEYSEVISLKDIKKFTILKSKNCVHYAIY